MNHLPDCTFKGYKRLLTSIDPNGPDQNLQITDGGIKFNASLTTFHPDDEDISFNFCPICGQKYSE